MTIADAIAAAGTDLRYVASVLLRGGRALSVDLETLKGGATYLNHAKSELADAYARAIDAGLSRVPGLTNYGTRIMVVP